MFDTYLTSPSADGLLDFAHANSGELSQFDIMSYVKTIAGIALNHSDVELLPETREVAVMLIDAVANAMANWEADEEEDEETDEEDSEDEEGND